MEKEFVTYEQALALKELGFDEPCSACFQEAEVIDANTGRTIGFEPFLHTNGGIHKYNDGVLISVPTKSQAFRFFREKYGMYSNIDYRSISDGHSYIIRSFNPKIVSEIDYDTYEQAEQDCLDKLISICKDGK